MATSRAQSGEWIQAAEPRARDRTPAGALRPGVVRTLLAAAAWTALGVIFALPALGTPGWEDELRTCLAQFWTWGLLTPAIAALDRRLPFPARELGRRFTAHLLASLVFTEIYFYLFMLLRALLGVTPWSSLRPANLISPAMIGWQIWSWMIYWVIAGGLAAYDYYRRYMTSELRLERLEHSFAEARLNALRMQLDPHFLFNALNTISSHVERDPKLTRRMIEHLGDLLRLSLESKDRQEIPLVEEMAFLEHYLAIQKIRFGEQLGIETRIQPEIRLALVPAFLIQPLVENAIRHGISRRAGGGKVVVAAWAAGERLEIRVMDDGAGLAPGWQMETSEGLGLQITRERIAGLHPNGAGRLLVQNREEGGTSVEISLPLCLAGEEQHDPALV